MRIPTQLGRRASTLAIVGALALTGVACNGDDDGGDTDTGTTTEDVTDGATDEMTDGTETETE